MKKVKNKKQELFRHELAKKHPSEIKKKAGNLLTKLAMLHEIHYSITDCNDKRNLKYFSKLYTEILPLVTDITWYVVKNEYSGIRKEVDDLVIKIQQVLGCLKVLHLRYESLRLPPKSDHLSWWKYSQKGNKEILNEMQTLLEEMEILLEELKAPFEEEM